MWVCWIRCIFALHLTVEPLPKSEGWDWVGLGRVRFGYWVSKYDRNWGSTAAGALTHSLGGDKETVAPGLQDVPGVRLLPSFPSSFSEFEQVDCMP